MSKERMAVHYECDPRIPGELVGDIEKNDRILSLVAEWPTGGGLDSNWS
jgi:hypothetical protein